MPVYPASMRKLGALMVLALLLTPAALAGETEEGPRHGAEGLTVTPRKPAELRADQLDMLFARLNKAQGPGAQAIEQRIWSLWMASDSPTAEILLEQATVAMNEGAPEQSLAILNRLVGSYPDFAEAWNKRATLYFMMGRLEESLADIVHTLDLEPRHFGALAGRGMILQRQKKYSEARAAYEEALAMNPAMEQVREAVKALEHLEQGI